MGILLGVTWSPAAATLPDLSSIVDIVEASAWEIDMPLAAGRSRVLVHGIEMDVSLADPGYLSRGWGERVNAVVERSRTPWVSLHLGFASERVRFDGHMLPESAPLGRDALLSRIIDNVRRAKATLDRPLLLENLDYCPEGAYEHICEPAFIREVLGATDTGLLLDIAHLEVTASWFSRTPDELLDELPLERIGEVHLSGPRPIVDAGNSGRLDDVHDAVTEREVRLLRRVLSEAQPRAVVLEYRRDPVRLREQLAMIGQVIERRRRPPGC